MARFSTVDAYSLISATSGTTRVPRDLCSTCTKSKNHAPAAPGKTQRSWGHAVTRKGGVWDRVKRFPRKPPPYNAPRSRQLRCISDAEPNATFRVGADGETGDFKGLTLSNSGPCLLRKPGLFFRQGADRVSAPAHRGLVFAGGPGFATTQTECVMTESRVAKRGL